MEIRAVRVPLVSGLIVSGGLRCRQVPGCELSRRHGYGAHYSFGAPPVSWMQLPPYQGLCGSVCPVIFCVRWERCERISQVFGSLHPIILDSIHANTKSPNLTLGTSVPALHALNRSPQLH